MPLRLIAGSFILLPVLFGFWLLCAMNASGLECLAGAAGAILATIGSLRFNFTSRRRFAFRPGLFAEAWRLPAAILVGSGQLARALARRLFTGRLPAAGVAAVPYRSCRDDPASATRRALAAAYPTCTPNCVVIGILPEAGVMLYHKVEPGPLGPLPRRLGAA